MVSHDVSAGLQFKRAELGVRRIDFDHPAQSIEPVHRYIFSPNVKPVASCWHATDRNIAVRSRTTVVGCAERNNHRTHLRVNIAKDVGNTVAIEPDRASCVRFVEAEVKTLSVEQRKNIVVERVEVRKIYAAAGRHDQNMRNKLLIFLLQP